MMFIVNLNIKITNNNVLTDVKDYKIVERSAKKLHRLDEDGR